MKKTVIFEGKWLHDLRSDQTLSSIKEELDRYEYATPIKITVEIGENKDA